jgi:hypothetical protein
MRLPPEHLGPSLDALEQANEELRADGAKLLKRKGQHVSS